MATKSSKNCTKIVHQPCKIWRMKISNIWRKHPQVPQPVIGLWCCKLISVHQHSRWIEFSQILSHYKYFPSSFIFSIASTVNVSNVSDWRLFGKQLERPHAIGWTSPVSTKTFRASRQQNALKCRRLQNLFCKWQTILIANGHNI